MVRLELPENRDYQGKRVRKDHGARQVAVVCRDHVVCKGIGDKMAQMDLRVCVVWTAFQVSQDSLEM